MADEAFIFDAARTPRGRGRADTGSLTEMSPVDLAAIPLRAICTRNALNPGALDDVILGCVDPVGDQGADIARSAALVAGCGNGVPGLQINRFCGSGLEAVALAASRVRAGDAALVAAGGVEMMSRVGMGASGMPPLTDPAIAIPFLSIPQGVAADLIATLDGHSRADVDRYAVESQRRAAAAWENGHFTRGVVPVTDSNGVLVLARDEAIRPDTTMSSLAELTPAFAGIATVGGFDAVALARYPQLEALHHVHHAGNSSQITDGAAVVLVGGQEAGERHGLRPRARVRRSVSIGSEPTIMLTGPIEASRRALAASGMEPADVDLWELNEAFASVVLHFMDSIGVAHERINTSGGAIAMGHPLGATGAMILGTLLDDLERTGGAIGVATLCAASGQAIAMVVERI